MSRVALCLCVIAFSAVAAEEAAAPAASAAETAKSNPKDLKPRPAEMAPLAAKTLLLGVAAAGETVIAVGDRGIILRSTDGAKWEQVASPVHATFTAVSFADADHGWVVGHDASILHTTDGGKTWTLQNFQPQDSKPLLSVLAVDAQHAYATGAYGLFLETVDGGAHWTPVDAPPILEDGLHLNALIRLKNGELFLAGETGLLGVSADGTKWTRLKLPYEGSLFGALPRGEKGALVFGLRGNVLASDDVHSNQWRKVDTQTTQSMFGGAFLAGGDIVLVGADGEILLIDASGSVRKARGPKDERSLGSGTLAGVLPSKDGLLMVGELGVSRLKLQK
jgi:photosystem II stability/assembly factor-like uncharacterized protein